MKYHSQNLNECKCGRPFGTKFWHGRAWLYTRREIHWEWLFGKFARGFGIYVEVGAGENDDGITLHACIPFIFSIFLCIAGLRRCKQPHKTGIAIHNGAFWIYPFTNENDRSSSDPWYSKNYSWNFPWTYDWYTTEILEHKANLPGLAGTLWKEVRGQKWKDSFESMRLSEPIKKADSEIYDYTYTLKSGEIQHRKATVYVARMTWRMRWWPLLPFRKFSNRIWVNFNDEVGEGTGSWKGGTTGCGYEMQYGETPLETLRRMEKERKFGR